MSIAMQSFVSAVSMLTFTIIGSLGMLGYWEHERHWMKTTAIVSWVMVFITCIWMIYLSSFYG